MTTRICGIDIGKTVFHLVGLSKEATSSSKSASIAGDCSLSNHPMTIRFGVRVKVPNKSPLW
jgi:hypothetical protein